MSYDGIFLQLLHSKNLTNTFSITASDYLKSNLDFFKKYLVTMVLSLIQITQLIILILLIL